MSGGRGQPAIYQSPGKCIYCGEDKKRLTDEHIVPLSLNGTMIFRDASCECCNSITKKFEEVVAHDLMGTFRVRYGIRTRHPKKRPKTFPLNVKNADGTTTRKEVPVSEYPAVAMLFRLDKCNYLLGRPPFDPRFDWIPVPYMDHDHLKDALRNHAWDGVTAKRMAINEFARMLAKIGHSFAVAEVGLAAFRPLATDIIRGRASNYGYLVGGSMDLLPAVKDAGDHELALGVRQKSGALNYDVVVSIRLFQQMGSPSYHVVVGRAETEQQVAIMKEYFSDRSVVHGPRAGA